MRAQIRLAGLVRVRREVSQEVAEDASMQDNAMRRPLDDGRMEPPGDRMTAGRGGGAATVVVFQVLDRLSEEGSVHGKLNRHPGLDQKGRDDRLDDPSGEMDREHNLRGVLVPDHCLVPRRLHLWNHPGRRETGGELCLDAVSVYKGEPMMPVIRQGCDSAPLHSPGIERHFDCHGAVVELLAR